MILLCGAVMAQSHVTMLFTCRTIGGQWIQPDSITVENLSFGWKETIEYPDTLYVLNVWTGIEAVETVCASSLQTTPNPFNGTTLVSLQMPEPDDVQMEVADMNGRIVETMCMSSLQTGVHSFYVSLRTPGTYVLTARVHGKTLSEKLVNTGNGGKDAIEYKGMAVETQNKMSLTPKSDKASSTHPFQIGDRMRYVAYVYGVASAAEQQFQTQSEEVVLVFPPLPVPGDAVPCPDMPTVTDYDGNVYNTVKLGSQCWTRENLRTTHYANGVNIPEGNTTSNTTPYYYDNDTLNIALEQRGYLYNWSAVMHGASSSDANPSDVQGICPNGWHVPSYAEWIQLTDYVSGQSQYVCGGDDIMIAKALASPAGWISSSSPCTPGNDPTTNNATGFSAVPSGGWRDGFMDVRKSAVFWTSTESSDDKARIRFMSNFVGNISQGSTQTKHIGFSVRCVRN